MKRSLAKMVKMDSEMHYTVNQRLCGYFRSWKVKFHNKNTLLYQKIKMASYLQ